MVENDEVLPRTTTARGLALANTNKGKKTLESLAKMCLHEYMALRSINPYEVARVARVRNPHFYTNTQERIFNDVYPRPKTKVVDQRYINIDYLRGEAYFNEAMTICEEFGLLRTYYGSPLQL